MARGRKSSGPDSPKVGSSEKSDPDAVMLEAFGQVVRALARLGPDQRVRVLNCVAAYFEIDMSFTKADARGR